MKTIFITLAFGLITGLLIAQETGSSHHEDHDTASFKLGKMNFLMWHDPDYKPDTTEDKEEEEDEQHIPMLGIGINGFLNPENKITLPANYRFLNLRLEKSINLNINAIEGKIDIVENYFNLVGGIDLEFSNYRFTNNNRLISGLDSVAGFKDTLLSLKKSKLTTTYVNFPVLIEINTNKNLDEAVRIQAGAVFGLKIGSHSKVVYENNGIVYKPKVYDDFHLLPFRYGATVRVGYGKVIFFANYMISEMFDDKKAPELHPFTVGIMVF